MKVFTTLLTVLLISATLFCLCGCQNNTITVEDMLSNSGDYSIEYVSMPHSSFDAHSGIYADKSQIDTQLTPFRSLQFVSSEKVTLKTIQLFAMGHYGMTFDEEKWPQYMLVGSQTEKYLVNIYYQADDIALVLVDYDGTVYFLSVQNQTLSKTDVGAVNPADFGYTQ